MDEDCSRLNEIFEALQTDVLFSSRTKRKSARAVVEAKRVADEVKEEFDRNIKEVQQVASKIFTEARGKLYKRFEEIEKETSQFMWDVLEQSFHLPAIKPTLKTEAANTSKTTFMVKGSNSSKKRRQVVDLAKKKLRDKIWEFGGQPKACATLERIDNIVDTVKRLKRQVEDNRQVIDKSLDKIEKRLVIAWGLIKTKPRTESIEQLLLETEADIIKDIDTIIVSKASRKISLPNVNKKRQKSGLIVKKASCQKQSKHGIPPEQPNDNSTNSAVERTFQDLKRETARLSEVTDADLKRAINTIKQITGKLPTVKPVKQLGETNKKKNPAGEAKSTVIGKTFGYNKTSKVKKDSLFPTKLITEKNKSCKSGGDSKKHTSFVEGNKIE